MTASRTVRLFACMQVPPSSALYLSLPIYLVRHSATNKRTQRNKTAWDRMGDVGNGRETSTGRRPCRPATAPATTVSSRWARSKGNHSNRAARENAKLLEEDSEELGAELQGSLERGELMDFAGLPAGKTQLLRSDRLNNDPQARRPYKFDKTTSDLRETYAGAGTRVFALLYASRQFRSATLF